MTSFDPWHQPSIVVYDGRNEVHSNKPIYNIYLGYELYALNADGFN